MKKFISTITFAAICAVMLSTQAFAEDILTDRSIYAEDREQLAQSAGSWTWRGVEYFVDPNTVMPVYTADIYDYAKTGDFVIKPFLDGNGQVYIANAVNGNGEFSGIYQFVAGGDAPGLKMLTPTSDKTRSADFDVNARRISAVMSRFGIDSDCKEIKLLAMNGFGYVYYIDNGTSKMLAATSIGGASGEVFSMGNGGIVEINDDLKAYADRKLAELEEYQKYLETLPPGENPPSGGNGIPSFMVDNTPYLDGAEDPSVPDNNDNPNTGGSSSALAGGIALAACVVGISSAKKRKDK